MKAVILAAGLGSRLRPLTDTLPKPMIPVAGKPILQHHVEWLGKAGIKDIILNTHYLSEVISDYFKSGEDFGVSIEYFKEPDLLGSAGMVKRLSSELQEPFILVYGDNMFDFDPKAFIDSVAGSQHLVTIALFDRYRSPSSGAAGGVVELSNAGTVQAFFEGEHRPDIPYVSAGLYCLKPELFEFIPEATYYDFGKQLFPDLVKRGIPINTYLFKSHEAVFGVDTPDFLERTRRYFEGS